MSFSLNELEALAVRAVRGAGYPFGLAQDASKACRFLCASGIDGAAALAEVLKAGFAEQIADHRPQVFNSSWQGKGDLCPLVTGALLSDSFFLLKENPLKIYQLFVPVMLLPFAANCAKMLGCSVRIKFDGTAAVTDGHHVYLSTDLQIKAQVVQVRAGESVVPTTVLHERIKPNLEAWCVLNKYAKLTYAPATEQSRQKGAGDGSANS